MQRVLVVDSKREPLMPCHPARGRQLLKAGKARVLRYAPFTIILTERVGGIVQPIDLRLDPGSKEKAFIRGLRLSKSKDSIAGAVGISQHLQNGVVP